MDNRQLDITSEGKSPLEMALSIAWPGAMGGKATHYKEVSLATKTDYYGSPTSSHSESQVESEKGKKTLILLWKAEQDALALPYPLDLKEAVSFVAGWLRNAEYGREPDHDGDNGKGWRVFTEDWGHVAGHRCAIVAVQPAWAMYGK
jgi:hypothetical protein